jgi:hypothetical protein
MCPTCEASPVDWSGQLDERFETLSEHLVWNDGPLSGVVRCRACCRAFAFQCGHEIWNTLLHWVLIPIAKIEPAEAEARYAEEAHAAREWLSILDDQRPGVGHCVAAWIRNPHQRPGWLGPDGRRV